jgi:dTDP-4-amino-4,6-dideoxygalactose transaminase
MRLVFNDGWEGDVLESPIVPFLDLPQQHRTLKQELLQVFASALDGAAFIGGSAVADFERDFACYTTTEYAIGVSNGTDALRLALLALGISAGSRVITVPNTFIATAAAISQAGCRIDFVDVDPNTCLMDPNRLEDLLRRRFASGPATDRPAAVVPVHLYGQCVDMDAIADLASRYGMKVLEDAAQAHGATWKGRRAGSLGDAAAFSFYPGKNLGACGDAGAVTTGDADVATRVRMLRDHGQQQKYVHILEGYNGRLDAIQAGFLRVKLRHLDAWNAKRRELARAYDEALASLSWLRPVGILPGNVSAYHLYVVHVPDREGLAAYLKDRGIATGMHYPLPLHLQKCYTRLGYNRGNFPNAEASAATLLSLPIFAEMEFGQLRHVVACIQDFGETVARRKGAA